MKLIPVLSLLLVTSASAQLMDSTATRQVNTRQMTITVNYGGVTDQYTISAEEVAGWIGCRGLSSEKDTTRPINTALLGHIRAEVQRCAQTWIKNRDYELGLVDQDDSMTLAQIRAAKQAVRLKYRQYTYTWTVPR